IVSLKKETNNTRIAETNTGEEGRYNFDNINIEKTASYLIKAEYPGYAPQEFKMSGQLIIDDAMYHRNINFVLLKEDRGGIRGYVIKGGDSGIKYATISVLSGDKLVVTASSDGQGNYIIPDIEPGDYTVSVYAQDYFNVEDLSGLVKKATVKEKKFTEVNFELTYKRYDATTVYLELLDHTGSPIDYENLKEPSGAEFHEVYRIYENDKGLHEKDGKQYLRFSDIPCGKDLELEVFFDYKYSAQILRYYKKTKMNFNCSGSDSDNEEYISLKMEIDPRMPQDENKGYLGGEFVLEKCDYNHFYTKWAKIILKDSQNRNYKEAIIEDERYFSIQNIDPGRYTVYLEGNNIVSDPRTINIKKGENYLTLSVRPKDSATFIKSISKNGFEIYFVGPISQDYIDSINWDDYTRALDNLKNNRVKPGLVKDFPTKIVVTDTDSQARWLGTGTCALGINGSYIQISYDELPDLVRSKDLLVMKMANYVWFNLPAATTPNENPEQEWNNFVKELNSMGNVEDCVLSALNPNSICGRYRVSAGGNLFQNVFLDYFVYHTQFDALNRNMKVSGNEQCFHLLSFFWEFFAKYVQKSASETVASTNPGSSSLFVYSNAADFYNPVGGKLGIYSKDQLLGGFWKQSVYDKLNPVQKAGVQATIVYSRVINFLKINPGKYSNQIAVNVVKFNQWIDKVLGTKGDRGTIEGMVREQSGGPKTPKENVIVIIGQKMAVTDKDGKFKIENIKIGEQKVRVIDGKTSRNLNVDLETVNIQKDKTIKRYFIVN
ncbi:MAG: carboxypeptidase-like regulatory domain-containing protein, partial [Candidatus Berkelbacteria bacterium]|nr:carboxypeptidase-like regulatory domain-containing protein [Candidatus Berkelbacteria bacterium]